MSRIAEKFAQLKTTGRAALIPYITAGYPTIEDTVELVPALARGGADIIELGIPFSDPLADGATIQRSSHVALENGVTVAACLGVAARLRPALLDIPFVFMGYFNPILSYGCERFARACAEAGVDGIIVPDLPPDEAGELLASCRAVGVDLIFLLAPTSTEERIEEVCRLASGFIYCVSLAGVTGARAAMSNRLGDFISRVRARTDLPLAVGFGISRPEHVAAVSAVADGAIVGSALIDVIDRAAGSGRVREVEQFLTALGTGLAPGQDVSTAAEGGALSSS